MDKCTYTNCPNFGRYCRRLHVAGEVKEKVVKKPKPIAKMSAKAKKIHQKEYLPAVKAILAVRPLCEIKIEGVCTGKAQGWNHAAGKHNKELKLDLKNGQTACNACNTWCEANHAKAVEMGFITKRNTETKRYKNTYKK